MKKLLLILLCLPLIGFGQLSTCGEKPNYTGNKFGNYKSTSEYKSYKKDISEWNKCNKDFVDNLESNIKEYLDSKRLDPIEGIYITSFNSRNLGKSAIVKVEDKYNIIFIEGYTWLMKIHKKGDITTAIEKMSGNKYNFTTTKSNRLAKSRKSFTADFSNNSFYFSDGSLFTKSYPNNSSRTSIKSKGSWQGNGSGVIISKSGYIVTNNHVINDASEIAVEFKYKNKIKEFNAKVIKVDKTNDLAIIKIDDDKFSNLSAIPYNFKTRSVDVGTEIFALGYPMALSLMGKDIKFTDGKVSSKTGVDGDITTYQISAPILPGNSGGPLFDTKGNLIGINSAGLARGGYESVGYSIKTSYLLNLIDVLPEKVYLPSNTKLASKPLTEQIKILSDYVVLIKVK